MTERPEIKRVTMPRDHDGLVYVQFTDGHRMVFVEHFEPMRASIMALMEVRIETANKQPQVVFHSKHQYPVNRSPFGFVLMNDGWTPRRFTSYWEVAHRHIETAEKKGRLRRAYGVVVRCGRKDLRELQAGEWPAPRPKR